MKILAQNKKANFDYQIREKFEVGISLFKIDKYCFKSYHKINDPESFRKT